MTSRIDLRSIAEAIAEHADAITAYASDPNVSQDVVKAETLGRAYLIEARLGRLREVVRSEDEEMCQRLREEIRSQAELVKSEAKATSNWMGKVITKQMGSYGYSDEDAE